MPPERLVRLARACETAGLDELWVWEDCFKESGIASAAVALASTQRITVGIGLMPAPLRNVALCAMEVGTLARVYPGRLVAGVGHGVQDWMGQVGGRVASPLTLLEEYVVALRRLLHGERVTSRGRYVDLTDVKLDWPPDRPPRLMVGGSGPKSLALAGRLGDGTLLGVPLGADELSAQVATTLAAAPPGHEVVTGQILATGPGAQERVDRELARWDTDADQGRGLAGDAPAIARALRRHAAAGATAVAVVPTRDEPDLAGLARFLATDVREALAAST